MILLNQTITTALAAQTPGRVAKLHRGRSRELLLEAIFAYGSGGTSVDVWIQSTIDRGVSWYDVANFRFLLVSGRRIINLSSRTPVTAQVTPGDGALAANTAVDGIIGHMLRAKITTVGTYAGGTSLIVHALSDELIDR